MRTYVVTGAGSGIGHAVATRLRDAGDRVIGIDLRGAEIAADLGMATGRAAAIGAVGELAPARIDGLLAAAGISAPQDGAATVAVNYFGATALLEGLRPLLARGGAARAVVVGSTSALLPTDQRTVAACLTGDESAARAAAAAQGALSYMSSKLALTLWMRRAAVSADWAGAGILLNGVAPGVVETAMTAPLFQDPAMLDLIAQSNPMAVDGWAKPEEIAELIAYLLSFKGHYLLGQMIFIDGGTDAIMRPETF